jgi:hypothetical protein
MPHQILRGQFDVAKLWQNQIVVVQNRPYLLRSFIWAKPINSSLFIFFIYQFWLAKWAKPNNLAFLFFYSISFWPLALQYFTILDHSPITIHILIQLCSGRGLVGAQIHIPLSLVKHPRKSNTVGFSAQNNIVLHILYVILRSKTKYLGRIDRCPDNRLP